MRNKTITVLSLLLAVFLVLPVIPAAAHAEETGYGYEVVVNPSPVAIGSEVTLRVRLTDYSELKSGIRGFQIDITDADDVLHDAVCTSLVTDEEEILTDTAKYQSSRDSVRHLFAKMSGTMAYTVEDLLEVRFTIPDSYTSAGTLTLPIKMQIENADGEQFVYTSEIEVQYAPADEIQTCHNYENGFCTICGVGYVQNTATGTYYGTVEEALSAAAEGETVQLISSTAEGYVMVYPGVTLDLNGCELTADYVVAFDTAHIIDSQSTGRLITGVKNLVLDEENTMIPVYDGTGYLFTRAGFALRQDESYTGEGIKINALVCPVRMDIVELLADGGGDNNIQIVLRLSWDTDEGTGSQEFKFTDAVVANVYSSNNGTWTDYSKMFTITITGFKSVANLKANIVVVSGTNAAYVSSASVSIT